MKEATRITVSELPPRPRGLNPAEISKIFGGCGALGAGCSQNKDCCDGKCQPYAAGFMSLTGGGNGYCTSPYRY